MSPPYGTCSACWSARVRCTHAHSSAGPSSQGRDQQQPDPYAQPRSSTAPRVHTSSALGSLYYLGVSNNQTYHYHPPQGQTTHQGHTHIPPPPPPPPTTTAPPQGPQGSFAPSRRGYHGGLPSPPTTSSSVDDHGGYHQAAAGQHSQAPTPYDDRSIAGNQGSASEDDQGPSRRYNFDHYSIDRPDNDTNTSSSGQTFLSYVRDHASDARGQIDYVDSLFPRNDATRDGSSGGRSSRRSERRH